MKNFSGSSLCSAYQCSFHAELGLWSLCEQQQGCKRGHVLLDGPSGGKEGLLCSVPSKIDGIDKNDRYANKNSVFFDLRHCKKLQIKMAILSRYQWKYLPSPFAFADQHDRSRWCSRSDICGYKMCFQKASLLWLQSFEGSKESKDGELWLLPLLWPPQEASKVCQEWSKWRRSKPTRSVEILIDDVYCQCFYVALRNLAIVVKMMHFARWAGHVIWNGIL